MAKPKEKTSLAFQQKCAAAGDKLRKFQADKLKEDMLRLFTEELHADLTLQLQYSTIALHSVMIKARSPNLYNMLISFPGSSEANKYVSMATYNETTEIQDIFRQIYIEDDVSPYLDKLSDLINSHEERQDREKSHMCDADPGSTHETLIKPDKNEGHAVLNGDPNFESTCDATELTDEALHSLAKTIVKQAIQDAIAIVKSNDQVKKECTDNGVVLNGMSDDDTEGEAIEASGNSEIPTLFSSSNSYITATEAETENSESFRQDVRRNTKCLENRVSIRSAKESSKESVATVLERVYGVQTAIKPCSQLGEDLVRILGQELTDSVVQVQGEKFYVHRCLLAVRSSYFNAMLSGSWRESDEKQIMLECVDPCVLRQTLFYLYGGVIEVDSSCSLGGLVMMADMYAMEGLKEVVAFNLNKEYCHFFHRPCSDCITGVPEALTLTMMYNMDALKNKCVKWINKNFGKVWATQTFALLPQEVLEFCSSTAVKDLAVDNVIDTMVECKHLNEKTPHLKWTEPIFDLITRLMDSAIEYASQNFVQLVSSNTFRKIDKAGIAFNRQPLDDIFGMVIMALSPENSCQAYLSLNKWVMMFKACANEESEPLYTREFLEFVEYLFKKCKGHLCLYIHQAANTVEWGLLSKDMQAELMQEASYVCIDNPNKGRVARPKLTSMQKKISATSPLSLKEYFDRHFGHRDAQVSSGRSPQKTKSNVSSNRGTSLADGRRSSSRERKLKQDPTSATVYKERSAAVAGMKNKVKANTEVKGQASKPPIKNMKQPEKKQGASMALHSKVQTTKKIGLGVKMEMPKCGKPVINLQTTNADTTEGDLDEVAIQKDVLHEADNTDSDLGEVAIQKDLLHDADDTEYSDCLIGDELMSRSQSTAAFQSSFGISQLKSAQSVDSFFDSRHGITTVVQRPIPTLEVIFIIPHEFYESF